MNIMKMVLLLMSFIFFIIGCSNSASSTLREDNEQNIYLITPGEPLQAAFTDDRLPGMKGIVENDQLQLFIAEETGSIAILNKNSGKIWHSNPPERETDTIATGVNKSLLSAQMQIDFYNKFNQLNSINTYSDSVAHKQYKFEIIPNGIKVYYQFGKTERSIDDLPLMISKARFDELSSKLDKTGQRSMMIAYTENQETSAYERNDSALNGLQLEKALQAFGDAGYTEEDLQQDMSELNFTQEKSSTRIFQAAIEYTLDTDSLVVNVPVSSIHYPEDYPVNMISLMNFFGAGGMEDQGSLFVPDGSGALIHFNNGKTEYPSYQQSVYGVDLALKVPESNSMEQKVRLPVFGLIYEKDALLGIIENGASVANINADISGRLNSYNYVYPSFYVINKDEVTLQANEQERTLPKFQDVPMNTDYTVRYLFLNGDKASYTGMAKSYQEYLVSRKELPLVQEGNETQNLPFYLDLVGSISKQKHFMGVPYRSIEPLTTFDEAEYILSQLQTQEIENINLKFSGWFNGGINHKLPDDISVENTIGGSRGLKEFITFTQENNISLYPDVALLSAYSGSGFNIEAEASRTLRGVPAAVYPIDITLDRRDRTKSPSYVISPKLVEEYTEDMLSELEEYETAGISLRDLADQLNSDFRENEQIYRSQSKVVSRNTFTMIQDKGLKIMAEGGNAYALPYISNLTDAPMGNSRFKLEDEEVPFYQMVIRGYVDYTGLPYNLSTYTNMKEYVLKCLEYGSGVHFKWINASNYTVKDTEFDYLYAVNYESWLEQAVEIYNEVNSILKSVENKQIKSHEKLKDGVYKTVYDNDMFVVVNYNQSSVTIEGNTIEPMGYVSGGEK
ncbi:hypothetical protein F9U64_13595 [Gracilibacillus oryzae]|uniref:Uncharacterized protein n=1 Tax=Gracilibacillus oryzae TaxID=1672701 RepID=A0A7C8KRJ7_9BACI|nr:DUF5696 domain-containing protein [Gracilibacillus oryzae]KAB8131012.1 hypothetical protein F9U64_13595 [Gracilibacillus oryzae]